MQTAIELSALTNAKLVSVWNDLADPGATLTCWKGKKDVLVGRILAAQGRKSRAAELATKPAKIEVDTSDKRGTPHDKPRAERKPRAKVGAIKKRDEGETVRSVALALLCKVDYYEDREVASGEENRVDANHPRARSVGITYAEMLASIKEKFPGAQTTAECLRWYASNVRNGENGYEGFKLPQRRPRSNPVAEAEPF